MEPSPALAWAQAYERITSSDARRPGAPIGPELPGQPLDVSRRSGRRAAPFGFTRGLLSGTPIDRCSRSWSSALPVRLDLSRMPPGPTSSSSGMDYPEGARVLNISVDLGVHGRDERTLDRRSRPTSGPSPSPCFA